MPILKQIQLNQILLNTQKHAPYSQNMNKITILCTLSTSKIRTKKFGKNF